MNTKYKATAPLSSDSYNKFTAQTLSEIYDTVKSRVPFDSCKCTFYNWVSRCRKAAAEQIPAANHGHLEIPRPKQDVVSIDIVPEQHTASQMQNSYLDNSHTIEVAMKDITVRISNDADPLLLTRTFRLLQELSC